MTPSRLTAAQPWPQAPRTPLASACASGGPIHSQIRSKNVTHPARSQGWTLQQWPGLLTPPPSTWSLVREWSWGADRELMLVLWHQCARQFSCVSIHEQHSRVVWCFILCTSTGRKRSPTRGWTASASRASLLARRAPHGPRPASQCGGSAPCRHRHRCCRPPDCEGAALQARLRRPPCCWCQGQQPASPTGWESRKAPRSCPAALEAAAGGLLQGWSMHGLHWSHQSAAPPDETPGTKGGELMLR